MLRDTTTIEALNQMADFLVSAPFVIERLNEEMNRLIIQKKEAEAAQAPFKTELLLRNIDILTKEKSDHEASLLILNPQRSEKISELTTQRAIEAELIQIINAITQKRNEIALLSNQIASLQQSNISLSATLAMNEINGNFTPLTTSYNHSHVHVNQVQHHNHVDIVVHHNPGNRPIGINLASQALTKFHLTQELNTNLKNIRSKQQRIAQLQPLLTPYDPSTYRNITSADFQDRLTQVQIHISNINSQLAHLEQKIATHTGPLNQLENVIKQVVKLNENFQLKDESENNLKTAKLERKVNEFDATIARLDEQIKQKTDANAINMAKQTDYQNNLLLTAPGELVDRLVRAMLEKLKLFEKQYPINQSLYVRRCLMQVETKIDSLVNIQDTETAKVSYCKLYGMMINFENWIKSNANNNNSEKRKFSESTEKFLAILTELQSSISIHKDKNLFVDSQQCQNLFQLSGVNEYSESQIHDFYRIEAQLYNTAHEALTNKHALLLRVNVPTKILSITNAVLLEAHKVLAHNPAIKQDEYKFLTLLLENVNEVLSISVLEDHPAEVRKAKLTELSKLIEVNTHGAPSFYNKLFGAVLMLTGALLATASIALHVTTVGMTTPITIGGIAAGSSLMLAGMGLFLHGRRKGLSKELVNLQDTLNTPEQLAWAVPPPAYSV